MQCLQRPEEDTRTLRIVTVDGYELSPLRVLPTEPKSSAAGALNYRAFFRALLHCFI